MKFRGITSSPMLGPPVFRRVSYTRHGSLDAAIKAGYQDASASLCTITEGAPAVQSTPIPALQTDPILRTQENPSTAYKTPSSSTSNSGSSSTPFEDHSTISSLSNTMEGNETIENDTRRETCLRDLIPELLWARQETERLEAQQLQDCRRMEYRNPAASQSLYNLRNVSSLNSLHCASTDRLSASIRAAEGCPSIKENRLGPGKTPVGTPLMTPRGTPQMTPRCGQVDTVTTPRLSELELNLIRAIEARGGGMTPRVFDDDVCSNPGGVHSSMPCLRLPEPKGCTDRPKRPSMGTPRTFDYDLNLNEQPQQPLYQPPDWRRSTCTNLMTVTDNSTGNKDDEIGGVPRLSSGFYDSLSMSQRHLPTISSLLSRESLGRNVGSLRLSHQHDTCPDRSEFHSPRESFEEPKNKNDEKEAQSHTVLRRNDARMEEPGQSTSEHGTRITRSEDLKSHVREFPVGVSPVERISLSEGTLEVAKARNVMKAGGEGENEGNKGENNDEMKILSASGTTAAASSASSASSASNGTKEEREKEKSPVAPTSPSCPVENLFEGSISEADGNSSGYLTDSDDSEDNSPR